MADGSRLRGGRGLTRPLNPGALGKGDGVRTSRSAILMGGAPPVRKPSLVADEPVALIEDVGDEAVESLVDFAAVDDGDDEGFELVGASEGSEGSSLSRIDRQKVAGVLASSEDWDDDRSDDPWVGPGAEGRRPEEKQRRRRRRLQITERDVAIIRLLGRYKFGYRSQIEAYCERRDLSRRLTQLAANGLLRSEKLTANQSVWTPTQMGLELVGLDVPNLSRGGVSPSTVGHTVGLLSLGIGFEKGDPGNNLLGEPGWPHEWRREENQDTSVRLERGETVVTERMISQSWRRAQALYPEAELKRMYQEAVEWRPVSPGESFGPEAEEGNEWMFVGQPPFKPHMPDMVLVRPRAADGSLRHIAIELELSTKPVGEWRRILTGFKGSEMFSTVAYFTHKRTVREGVRAVNANHVGLVEGSELVIKKYVPRLDNPFWG